MGGCVAKKKNVSKLSSMVSEDLDSQFFQVLPIDHQQPLLDTLLNQDEEVGMNLNRQSSVNSSQNSISLTDIGIMTPYRLLMMYDNKDSKIHKYIEKNRRIKQLVIQTIDQLREKYGQPENIQISINNKRESEINIQLDQYQFERDTKYILVIGLSGHGKTTLLNSLANYIYNPNHELDNNNSQRAKIISQEQSNRSVSQTQDIKLYKLKYQTTSFVFIDTPGLGDTSGSSKDDEIFKKITGFMSQPNARIDFIFFISQTTSQLYVEENQLLPLNLRFIPRLLRIFAVNMAPRIFHLITFSDFNQLDPRMFGENSIFYKQIQKGKNQKLFQFQNSVTYQQKVELIHKYYFQKNQMNYQSLMEMLQQKKQIEQKEYDDAKKIIESEKQLEKLKVDTLDKLKEFINFLKINKQNQNMLERAQRGIRDYSQFEYWKLEIKREEKPCQPNRYVTYCTKCQIECHNDCSQSQKDLKYCLTFLKQTECSLCKCTVEAHQNQNFNIVEKCVNVKYTNENLKDLFDKFTNNSYELQQEIRKNQEAQEQCMRIILQQYSKLTKIILLLNESSLFEFPKGQNPVDLLKCQYGEDSKMIIEEVEKELFLEEQELQKHQEYLQAKIEKYWLLYQKCEYNNRLNDQNNESLEFNQITIMETRDSISSMHCRECNLNCHYDCKYQQEGKEKDLCQFLLKNGNCKICKHGNKQHILKQVIEYDYTETQLVIQESVQSNEELSQQIQDNLNRSIDILRGSIHNYLKISKVIIEFGGEDNYLNEMIQKNEEFGNFMKNQTQQIE